MRCHRRGNRCNHAALDAFFAKAHERAQTASGSKTLASYARNEDDAEARRWFDTLVDDIRDFVSLEPRGPRPPPEG